ncbi:MAG: hypothetical protein LBU69_05220, partial [Deltaproteobacteria bacterium]|nr:hypothetical protein [Deltaproteobacteria bacterium]
PIIDIDLTEDFFTFMRWVESEKTMKVRANADTPHDAEVARYYGAEGIGLCRTEHMFFESDRIDHVRAMILADELEDRQKALEKLLPLQRGDFYGIFKAMNGLPVTIRTLDPPLHEFLPHSESEIADLAKKLSVPVQKIQDRIDLLKEQNPMLGLRGCRLGILYPEITAMQARAIFEAALKATEEGIKVLPEIMIPLIGNELEFATQKAVVDKVAEEVLGTSKARVKYMVGTMIELPRAALVAGKVVDAGAQFFSFGTNDLTQTTFGLSRDDSGIFLPQYLEKQIWPKDPFVSIDVEGVGLVMEIGVVKGRSVNPTLKIGICGEHGGDPASVKFCYGLGFDYVSCSPLRVPIARLASAQASLEGLVHESAYFLHQSQPIVRSKVTRKRQVSEMKKQLIKKVSEAITPTAQLAIEAIKPMAQKVLNMSKKGRVSKKVLPDRLTNIGSTIANKLSAKKPKASKGVTAIKAPKGVTSSKASKAPKGTTK